MSRALLPIEERDEERPMAQGMTQKQKLEEPLSSSSEVAMERSTTVTNNKHDDDLIEKKGDSPKATNEDEEVMEGVTLWTQNNVIFEPRREVPPTETTENLSKDPKVQMEEIKTDTTRAKDEPDDDREERLVNDTRIKEESCCSSMDVSDEEEGRSQQLRALNITKENDNENAIQQSTTQTESMGKSQVVTADEGTTQNTTTISSSFTATNQVVTHNIVKQEERCCSHIDDAAASKQEEKRIRVDENETYPQENEPNKKKEKKKDELQVDEIIKPTEGKEDSSENNLGGRISSSTMKNEDESSSSNKDQIITTNTLKERGESYNSIMDVSEDTIRPPPPPHQAVEQKTSIKHHDQVIPNQSESNAEGDNDDGDDSIEGDKIHLPAEEQTTVQDTILSSETKEWKEETSSIGVAKKPKVIELQQVETDSTKENVDGNKIIGLGHHTTTETSNENHDLPIDNHQHTNESPTIDKNIVKKQDNQSSASASASASSPIIIADHKMDVYNLINNDELKDAEEPNNEEEDDWTPEQHRAFVLAIFEVGMKNCSPSVIMETMNDLPTFITRERTKSHLQKYRKTREKSKQEFLADYDTFMKSAKTVEETAAAAPHPGETEKNSTISSTSAEAKPLSSDDVIASVLGTRTPGELLGGEVAGYVSYSTMKKCSENADDANTLKFRGAKSSFPTLTEKEKKSPLGVALLQVKGMLSYMTDHLLKDRFGLRKKRRAHHNVAAAAAAAAKELTTKPRPPSPEESIESSGQYDQNIPEPVSLKPPPPQYHPQHHGQGCSSHYPSRSYGPGHSYPSHARPPTHTTVPQPYPPQHISSYDAGPPPMHALPPPYPPPHVSSYDTGPPVHAYPPQHVALYGPQQYHPPPPHTIPLPRHHYPYPPSPHSHSPGWHPPTSPHIASNSPHLPPSHHPPPPVLSTSTGQPGSHGYSPYYPPPHDNFYPQSNPSSSTFEEDRSGRSNSWGSQQAEYPNRSKTWESPHGKDNNPSHWRSPSRKNPQGHPLDDVRYDRPGGNYHGECNEWGATSRPRSTGARNRDSPRREHKGKRRQPEQCQRRRKRQRESSSRIHCQIEPHERHSSPDISPPPDDSGRQSVMSFNLGAILEGTTDNTPHASPTAATKDESPIAESWDLKFHPTDEADPSPRKRKNYEPNTMEYNEHRHCTHERRPTTKRGSSKKKWTDSETSANFPIPTHPSPFGYRPSSLRRT